MVATSSTDTEKALGDLLDRVTRSLHASRVVAWEHRPEENRLSPLPGPAAPPEPTEAAGNPLLPALGQDAPMDLDPAPDWARGPVMAVRVDETRLLTIEWGEPESGPTDPQDPAVARTAAGEAARLVAPVLRLHDQHRVAVAAADRADRLVDFLRSMNATATTGRLPDTLLDTALAVGRAAGGAVASWIGHEGTVLAVAGQQGGPLPGKTFAMGEGDLARAAETGTPVDRGPDGDDWPVLAWPGERWNPPGPAYRTVLPLIEPGGMTTGLLALWGARPLEEQGLSLLEALAPLLATQLRTANELDRLRARATIDALTGLPNRRALENRLAEEQARFDRYQRPVSLLVVQLEYDDGTAEAHDQAARDTVLQAVATAIQTVVRETDFAARYDRARLAILLPETAHTPALHVADRVRRAATPAAEPPGPTARVPISIGVSSCPSSVDRPGELLEGAETALRSSHRDSDPSLDP